FELDGRDAEVSYPELGRISMEIAQGLIALGIEVGDRGAVLGLTSAHWTMADCGTLTAGAVVTPIYHTNSPEECAYVLGHSGARLLFCDADQVAKIAQIRDQCPDLEHIVVLHGDAEGAITLDELRGRSADVPAERVHERVAATQPGDLATLVYTSGTTGAPKGCMLTHQKFLATVDMYARRLHLNRTHAMYQFLPLAHVLARIAQMVTLGAGARIVYWTGDTTKIAAELQARAPTHFPAVPRIYEKIHAVITGRVADSGRARKAMFEWALRCGGATRRALREQHQPGLATDLQYRLADRLVLSKVRGAFGPKLQLALVGAAPIAKDLLEFFDACGVLVGEGYGLTETCAAATLNTPGEVRFGSVGTALPGTEVVIAPDGEIMIGGPHVFKGYYNNPEATAETLDADGWLHSGDLGTIDEDGFVFITGRKKDIIITSSGKNVTPVNIESELKSSRYITEAVVYGDNRNYLVSLLTLDRDEAVKLAERLEIATDPATIAAHPGVRAELESEIERVNQKFARIEQIKKFAVLEHDFTQDGGELTPTLKIKRAVVYDKYADVFDGLYDGA
ncbi:MAG: long-chain fatty acid--CoA ligase, partial [Solirubrobacterales bacterium]|nr:long-chain fatty acid--CoA ligase [Solirubrobacterales bacterium]